MFQSEYKRHIDEVYASCKNSSMLEKLLNIMSQTLDVSGVEMQHSRENQKKRIRESKNHSGVNKVVRARFALGNDDGAYLRMNIMPLQTVIDDNDLTYRLSTKMSLEMQNATFRGLLNAYETSCNDKLQRQRGVLLTVWGVVKWLLSIGEVRDFVDFEVSRNDQGDCVVSKARSVIEQAKVSDSMPDFEDDESIHALVLVVDTLLYLFVQKVNDSVRAQLKKTEESMDMFKDSLKRLESFSGEGKDWFDEFSRQIQRFEKDSVPAADKRGYVSYAIARGLCGRRAPHHKAALDDLELLYNIPRVKCPSLDEVSRVLCYDDIDARVPESPFPSFTAIKVDDFSDFKGQEQTLPAMWSPSSSIDSTNEAVAACSVIEHLVDHYKKNAARVSESKERSNYLAHAATAKLLQLEFMADVFSYRDRDTLCPGNELQTNPVKKDSTVFYAPDAGLIKISDVKTEYSEAASSSSTSPNLEQLSGSMNSDVTYDDFVSNLYLTIDASKLAEEDYKTLVIRSGSFSAVLPPDNTKNMVDKHAKALLGTSIQLLIQRRDVIKRKAETESARQKLDSLKHESLDTMTDAVEKMARTRREEVWNDSMREAAISGDRLYAFVRQLSGTIHETVDAVCVVDESMLVRHQKDRQADAKRLSMMASQQQMQLVSNVFRSVINESGLTLGIDEKKGLDGELKVVSNTLRKQVSELTSGSSNSEGFFTNSVKLENLLAQGTGEITLSGLFSKLREVGLALQDAAINDSTDPGNPMGPSLDFLSSPRNSLILRWKPESHAAIRQAFDTFQREMESRHRMMGMLGRHRKITAFELMEGRSDELTMAFATYCAHTLAHQRMFSAGQAPYLGQWAARANMAAMRFSCDKLISVACEYVTNTPRPSFVHEMGWEWYFGVRD